MKVKSVSMLLMTILLAIILFETPTVSAVSQYVHNVSTVCDSYKFQNTGWNIQNFNVEMPENRASAVIYASGTSYNSDYSRKFLIYVNDVKVYEITVTGSFSTPPINILNYLRTGTNKIGLVLTTWTWGGRSQYWLVSSQINVKYSASKHIGSSKSWFAPYYKFRNTGGNILNFKAAVPNGLVSASIQISGTSFGDQYVRVLQVFVDGQLITPPPPDNWFYPQSDSWTSGDITNLLAFKKYVTIGVMLTTYEYNSGVCWRVTGTLRTTSRSEVWPDNDASRWPYNDYAMSVGGASVYDTQSSDHENQFLGISSFEVKGRDTVSYPVFYVGTMMHIPESTESAYGLPWWVGTHLGLFISHEIRISIKYPNGNLVPPSWIPPATVQGYASPNSDGTDYAGIGSDMLKIFGILATAFGAPQIGVPATIASTLIKYLPGPGWPQPFSYGRDSSGVLYLNDLRGIKDDLSDLIVFTVNFSGVGDYTISVSDTLTILDGDSYIGAPGPSWFTIAKQTYTYETVYHYGP